ncbi:MAG: hypothetical protein ABIK28_03850, partial [Planctomycetota bacterium]
MGPRREWNADGWLEKEFSLKDGRRSGCFSLYHPGGKFKKLEVYYENGREHGLLREWDTRGGLRRE